jgi:hypothetical protein
VLARFLAVAAGDQRLRDRSQMTKFDVNAHDAHSSLRPKLAKYACWQKMMELACLPLVAADA